jgi:hypothetical protein
MKFQKYRRTQIAEMRPVTQEDIEAYNQHAGQIIVNGIEISASIGDLRAGSPKLGDMIARNPQNHLDQCLVAEQYFKDNFEPL